MNKDDPDKLKSRDSVNGEVSALRWVYRQHVHKSSWAVNKQGDTLFAQGNPLDHIRIKREFRKVMHSKQLNMDMSYELPFLLRQNS